MGQTPQAPGGRRAYSRRMSLRKRFFAATYDSFSRRAEEAGLRDMRHGLIAEASGAVLEIGAGTAIDRG